MASLIAAYCSIISSQSFAIRSSLELNLRLNFGVILLYRFTMFTLPKPSLCRLFSTSIVVMSMQRVSAVFGLIMMIMAHLPFLSHSRRSSKRCSPSSENNALLFITVVSVFIIHLSKKVGGALYSANCCYLRFLKMPMMSMITPTALTNTFTVLFIPRLPP